MTTLRKDAGSRRLRTHRRARGDAFRLVYAVRLAGEIWVVHTFQKKSKQGIKTPEREMDVIKYRLKRLKEMLP